MLVTAERSITLPKPVAVICIERRRVSPAAGSFMLVALLRSTEPPASAWMIKSEL